MSPNSVRNAAIPLLHTKSLTLSILFWCALPLYTVLAFLPLPLSLFTTRAICTPDLPSSFLRRTTHFPHFVLAACRSLDLVTVCFFALATQKTTDVGFQLEFRSDTPAAMQSLESMSPTSMF